MGKTWGLLGVAALALALGGCVSTAEPVAEVEQASLSEVFLSDIRPDLSVMHDATDETLLGMGESICNLYAEGKSEDEVKDLVRQASDLAAIRDDGIAVAKAAVAYICPERG